ncbi:MAG: Dam family site-specific DNA-(adenine-N6)-methyltransferase [Alistipes sp.]|nr:Dam family site-specific DNA-(adenine-N6)-methyltransferase [Alistipes sp.]
MKPLLKYRGGKSKEIPYIQNRIPDYEGHYIEPFFGGGALYFHLKPQHAIINDINTRLMNFYRAVQHNYHQLREELDEIEGIYDANRQAFDALKLQNPELRVPNGNETLYYQLRDMFNHLVEPAYSDAALYYFINKTAYSGMIRYNAKGEFNVPFGRYKHLNTSCLTEEYSRLLAAAEIFDTDYQDIFEMAGEDDFMFLDPPYDCVFSDYGNEEYRNGFTDECHIRLAEHFRNLRCKALLVIGRTPLTERLYGDLIVDEYEKTYAVNIRNRFRSCATHILVQINY